MHTVKYALEELMLVMDRTDATVIMAEVLGVNRAWIAANPMRLLTETQDAQIEMMAAQRAMGRPVAYILNRREFYGRDFALDGSVLIPRPETETLVEAALARMAPKDTCLDLGTGSGAVAVTIASQRPENLESLLFDFLFFTVDERQHIVTDGQRRHAGKAGTRQGLHCSRHYVGDTEFVMKRRQRQRQHDG